MGAVRFGVPRELVLSLKEEYSLHTFFETGTLEGHSSAWAAGHFSRVVTVDVEAYPTASGNLNPLGVFPFIYDSAKFLELLNFELIYRPTLFWLDAHTNDYCPVLREIRAINAVTARDIILIKGEPSGMTSVPYRHVIMVDDARLFDVLPTWPSKLDVVKALSDNGNRVVCEIDDVFVATPCP